MKTTHKPLIFSASLAKLIEISKDENVCLKILEWIKKKQENRANGFRNDGHRACWSSLQYPSRILAPKLPGTHFSFREKKGMISYTPNGKDIRYNDDGQWSLEGRQAMNAGRWIGKMFSPKALKRLKLEGAPVAEVATIIKAEEARFSVRVEKVSLREAYSLTNYYTDNDTDDEADTRRPVSCMFNKDVAPFYKLFGVEECFVLVDSIGKFVARALIWPEVYFPAIGETWAVMDRIYWIEEEHRKILNDHAKASNMLRKVQDAQGWYGFYKPNGDLLNVHGVVKQVIGNDRQIADCYHPYVDTIRYQYEEDGAQYLTTESFESNNNVRWDYEVTRGHRDDARAGQIMDHAGVWRNRESVVEIDGEYYHIHDPLLCCVEDDGSYQLRENCQYVRECGWFHKESTMIVMAIDHYGESQFRRKRNCALVDGEWYYNPSYHYKLMKRDDGVWCKRFSLAIPNNSLVSAIEKLRQCPKLPLSQRLGKVGMMKWNVLRKHYSIRTIAEQVKYVYPDIGIQEWIALRYRALSMLHKTEKPPIVKVRRQREKRSRSNFAQRTWVNPNEVNRTYPITRLEDLTNRTNRSTCDTATCDTDAQF